MPLINSLESGVAALKSFTKGIDVIGNNIANVNTIGYKASRVDYSESFSSTLQRSVPSGTGGGSNSNTMQIGSGVKLGDIRSRFTQGTLTETSVPTDLSISGEGFFVVKDNGNNTNFATRAGNFRTDNQGYLTTSQGYRVQGLNNGDISYDVTVDTHGSLVYTPAISPPTAVGDLQLSFDRLEVGSGMTNSTGGAFTDTEVNSGAPQLEAFEVTPDGRVRLMLSNGDAFTRGQILVTVFQDNQALVHEGNGLFSNWDSAGVINSGSLDASSNTPGQNGLGTIESGKLEMSNVELTEEFANIITMQRSFQAGARIVTTSDQILEEVVNLKR